MWLARILARWSARFSDIEIPMITRLFVVAANFDCLFLKTRSCLKEEEEVVN